MWICALYIVLALVVSAVYYLGLPGVHNLSKTGLAPWGSGSRIVAADGSTLMSDQPFAHKPLRFSHFSALGVQSVLAAIHCPDFLKTEFDPWRIVKGMGEQTPVGCEAVSRNVARIMYHGKPPTLLHEALLAIRLENQLSRKRLLNLYLNHADWGHGIYGMETASQGYFNQPASQLDWPQAVLLAAMLVESPDFKSQKQLLKLETRRRNIFKALARSRAISQPSADYFSQVPVYLDPAGLTLAERDKAPGFNRMVLKQVLAELKVDEKTFWKKGYTVHTTLDPNLQQNAAFYLSTVTQNGALMTLDDKNRILAYVGTGKSVAPTLRHPVGSLIQPVIAAAALEQGITPQMRFEDRPVSFGSWQPRNPDGKHYGSITLAQGLAQSNTVMATQLMKKTGPDNVVKTARKLGIQAPLPSSLHLAVGMTGVTLQEITTAYSVFQNQGQYRQPYAVERIQAANGKVLYRHQFRSKQVLSAKNRDTMVRLLQGVVQHGAGQAGTFSAPVAGVTGPSDDCNAAWFVGFTPKLTTGLWVNTPQAACQNAHMVASRVWKAYMGDAQGGDAAKDFRLSKAPLLSRADFVYPRSAVEPAVRTQIRYVSRPAGRHLAAHNKPVKPRADDGGQSGAQAPVPMAYVETYNSPEPAAPPKRMKKIKGWMKKSWRKMKSHFSDDETALSSKPID